jgi:hypothetical protein
VSVAQRTQVAHQVDANGAQHQAEDAGTHNHGNGKGHGQVVIAAVRRQRGGWANSLWQWMVFLAHVRLDN